MKYFYLLLFVACLQNLYAQNFPINATAAHSGGTYSIYRSPFDNTTTIGNLRKPIIWVEGFEIGQPVTISDNYTIINQGDNNGGPSLASRLHSSGYDIIVLNFNYNGDYIQRNAKVLEDLINAINSGKPNSEQLVVMGYSMGGLIARYALVEMENQSVNHQTRLYVSYDAPHKGAHIPASVQALALTFNSQTYRSVFPELATLIDGYNSPAATQMLKFRVPAANGPSQTIPVSTGFTNFFNELNSLNANGGFPVNCQSVGLSLGSWSGIPQRADFDSNADGFKDFQYSGFPAVYINFPVSAGSGSPQVWNLNACQAVAAFSFQSFLSTASCITYPYYSTRSTYLGLQNYDYSTYWYRNSTESQLLPLGAWSNIYNYANNEAIDFAPGSFSNTYEQVVNTLNSQINCSFAYYKNSSFISSISALAFNTDADNNFTTDDLFYKIGDDVNRLSKTKFNDIYAFCGENTSHTSSSSIAKNPNLLQWVLNKVTGQGTTACYCGSSVAISGPNIVCSANSTFTASNIPPNVSLTWNKSSNLNYISGQGTSSYTVNSNGASAGFVSVSPSSQCGTAPSVTQSVMVGSPSPTFININASSCPEYYFDASAVPNATSYFWQWSKDPSGIIRTKTTPSSSSGKITLFDGSGNYRIGVKATSACGTSDFTVQTFVMSCGGTLGGKAVVATFPNPTSSTLTIQVTDSLSTNTQSNALDQPYELQIMDRYSRKVFSAKSSDKAFQISTDGLPDGIYYLNLFYKDALLQKQIIIRR